MACCCATRWRCGAQGAAEADQYVEQLRARFEASRRRGDRVHLREEARFALHLEGDPAHRTGAGRRQLDGPEGAGRRAHPARGGACRERPRGRRPSRPMAHGVAPGGRSACPPARREESSPVSGAYMHEQRPCSNGHRARPASVRTQQHGAGSCNTPIATNYWRKDMNRAIRLLSPLLAALCLSWTTTAGAASHREAPQIAQDPTADITDVYFFRSWEDPSKAVLIMNVIPGQEPSSGPNYFNFADDVRYTFHLDVDGDGDADDLEYEVRFKTSIRGPRADLNAAAVLRRCAADHRAGRRRVGRPDPAGRATRSPRYATASARDLGMDTMFAVPSNVGPLTMPNYEDLAGQGIYAWHQARAYSPVSATRRSTSTWVRCSTPSTCAARRSAAHSRRGRRRCRQSVRRRSLLAASTSTPSRCEMPISRGSTATTANAVIGMYASTSRPKFTTA